MQTFIEYSVINDSQNKQSELKLNWTPLKLTDKLYLKLHTQKRDTIPNFEALGLPAHTRHTSYVHLLWK